jgi:hypothetical protein
LKKSLPVTERTFVFQTTTTELASTLRELFVELQLDVDWSVDQSRFTGRASRNTWSRRARRAQKHVLTDTNPAMDDQSPQSPYLAFVGNIQARATHPDSLCSALTLAWGQGCDKNAFDTLTAHLLTRLRQRIPSAIQTTSKSSQQ